MSDAAEKRFLSRKDVSQIFEVSPHTVTRWAKAGKLPCVLSPTGRRRYLRIDVMRLLEGVTGGGANSTPEALPNGLPEQPRKKSAT